MVKLLVIERFLYCILNNDSEHGSTVIMHRRELVISTDDSYHAGYFLNLKVS